MEDHEKLAVRFMSAEAVVETPAKCMVTVVGPSDSWDFHTSSAVLTVAAGLGGGAFIATQHQFEVITVSGRVARLLSDDFSAERVEKDIIASEEAMLAIVRTADLLDLQQTRSAAIRALARSIVGSRPLRGHDDS